MSLQLTARDLGRVSREAVPKDLAGAQAGWFFHSNLGRVYFPLAHNVIVLLLTIAVTPVTPESPAARSHV
jgi:hypothetical protein